MEGQNKKSQFLAELVENIRKFKILQQLILVATYFFWHFFEVLKFKNLLGL